MKKFIEKLIGRLEERKSEVNGPADIVWNNAVKMCIDAANQLAEEYKQFGNSEQVSGWIPCDTQKEPTENGKYLIYVQHYMNKDLYDVNVAEWIGEWKVAYEWNVVAWRPIVTYNKESSMAKCKYPNEVCRNMTMLNGTAYCDSVPCSLKDEIPKQTNADKIRSMNDEELAELFTKLAWNSEVQTTPLKYLDWLQSEAE